jgi:hypothetical protein
MPPASEPRPPTARFLAALIVGAVAAFFALNGVLGSGVPDESAAPPPWPDFRREYPSAYRGVSVTHNLLASGLFGVGRRVREADVLLAGSSHAEFGFSAGELAAEFQRRGQPIRAYNIGVGWGEGFAFPAGLVARHDLQQKMIVLDLYRVVEPLTAVGRQALASNRAESFVRILNMWLSFLTDRLLDGVIGKIETRAGTLAVLRRLDQSVMYRRWEDGDLAEYWTAALGRQYAGPGSRHIGRPPGMGAEIVDPALLRRTIDAGSPPQRQNTAFATFIPYVLDDGLTYYDAAAQAGMPLIVVRAEGIQYADGRHANAIGRTVITRQVAAALAERGITGR